MRLDPASANGRRFDSPGYTPALASAVSTQLELLSRLRRPPAFGCTPRLERVLVLLAVVLALGVAARVGGELYRVVGRPWPGFGMMPDGTIAPLGLAPLRHLPHLRSLRFADRLVSIDGAPAGGAAAAWQHAARVPLGTQVRYGFARRSGESFAITVPTGRFRGADVLELCLPFFLGGLAGILLGALPLLSRPGDVVARLYFAFNLGLGVNFGLLAADAYFLHRLPRFGFVAAGLAASALLHLALRFPRVRGPLRARPRSTLALVYGAGAVAIVLRGTGWVAADAVLTALLAVGLAAMSVNTMQAALRPLNLVEGRQARILAPGLLLLLLTGLAFAAADAGLLELDVPVFVFLLPLWIVAALITYATTAHDLFAIDGLCRRALGAVTLAAASIGIYLGLFAALRPWLGATCAWAVSGSVVAVASALAAVLTPLRESVESAVERLVSSSQRESREILARVSQDLARLRGEAELVALLRDSVQRATTAALRVVTGENGAALTEVAPLEGAEPLVLRSRDPIVAALAVGRPLRIDASPREGAGRASPAERRAAELGVGLVVALPLRGARAGALVLGTRTDGRAFTQDDELLLESLAAQAAVSLENSRAWDEIRALEQRLAAENLYLREEAGLAPSVAGIVGESEAIRRVLAQVEKVAPTDATVLVQGESGTGKELIVGAIHAASRRRDRVLVRVACAAIPESLLESEFFGHERGAFTGANARRAGRLEVADGGTVFLDDVDTLPLGVQAKLLRAIQEGEVQRLGSNTVRRVDVRVIAATNRDLRDEVRAGRFREDLYYRLNVVPLHVPPLRERREDVPRLVEHFVREDGPRLGCPVDAVSPEAMKALAAHSWPGNIRELRNVVQRALVLSRDGVLRLAGPLEGRVPADAGQGCAEAPSSGRPLAEQLRDLKLRRIREALADAGGNHRIAAERLGLQRQSLTRMIRDLGLREETVTLRAPRRSIATSCAEA